MQKGIMAKSIAVERRWKAKMWFLWKGALWCLFGWALCGEGVKLILSPEWEPCASLGCLAEEKCRVCCSAKPVTLESSSAVTGLADRVTVEKDNAKASKEPGVCSMDAWGGEAMWRHYSGGNFQKLFVLPFSEKYSLPLSLCLKFWKNTFINLGCIILFIILKTIGLFLLAKFTSKEILGELSQEEDTAVILQHSACPKYDLFLCQWVVLRWILGYSSFEGEYWVILLSPLEG